MCRALFLEAVSVYEFVQCVMMILYMSQVAFVYQYVCSLNHIGWFLNVYWAHCGRFDYATGQILVSGEIRGRWGSDLNRDRVEKMKNCDEAWRHQERRWEDYSLLKNSSASAYSGCSIRSLMPIKPNKKRNETKVKPQVAGPAAESRPNHLVQFPANAPWL